LIKQHRFKELAKAARHPAQLRWLQGKNSLALPMIPD
jgi:hypothetical protein